MLHRLQDFLSLHRRKFVVTILLVVGSFFAARYAQRKLVEYQERQARAFFERTRRMHHFESTERTCNQVILGMGEEMSQVVLKECSTTELLDQLRQNPKNKVDLWEKMKIVSFTRLATFVYAPSMLVIALRVQLNLLGGYIYRDIMTGSAEITDELKQQYLSLIRHFVTGGGLRELVHYIRSQVLVVIKSMPLTRQLTLNDLEQVFNSLQMAIKANKRCDPNSRLSKYLLPTTHSDFSALLQQMYNQTLDLLESEDATAIGSHNVSRGFVLACDAIAELMGETLQHLAPGEVQQQPEQSLKFNQNLSPKFIPVTNPNLNQQASSENNDNLLNINSVLMELSKIIPIISGLTSNSYGSKTRSNNLPTQLLGFYVGAENAKTLGAKVYETFSLA